MAHQLSNPSNPIGGFPDSDKSPLDEYLKYLQAMWRWKWLILSASIIAAILSTLYMMRQPDYYEAKSRILVYSPMDGSAIKFQEIQKLGVHNSGYYGTQLQIITGNDVAREAVRILRSKQNEPAVDLVKEAAVIRRGLSASIIRGTSIIVISYSGPKPDECANVVNAIADAYVRQTLREELFASEQILKWFPAESIQAKSSDPLQMIQDMKNPEFIKNLPSVVNDPAIRALNTERIGLSRAVDEILYRYTPEHPEVKTLNQKIHVLDSQIHDLTEKTVNSLKAALMGEFKVSNIKILERATAPHHPIGPNRIKKIMLATLVAMSLATLLALLYESLDKTIKSEDDLIDIQDLPHLGKIPMFKPKKKISKRSLSDTGDNMFKLMLDDSETIDHVTTLNTALVFSMPKGKNKLIIVTSPHPHEGKSTVSLLLSIVIASLGTKTLCVELDLRKPVLARNLTSYGFDIKRGMTDYLVGQASLDEITHSHQDLKNIDFIFAGELSPNPTILFTSDTLSQFFDQVASRYDRIIIDSPPILDIPDTTILSGISHGVVLVARAGKTPRKDLIRAVERLRFVKTNIFGSILNGSMTNPLSSIHGYYGYGYGKK